MIMKKNYKKPISKRIELDMECIMAAESLQKIQRGLSNGDHDANAKRNHFLYDDAEDNY